MTGAVKIFEDRWVFWMHVVVIGTIAIIFAKCWFSKPEAPPRVEWLNEVADGPRKDIIYPNPIFFTLFRQIGGPHIVFELGLREDGVMVWREHNVVTPKQMVEYE